MNIAICEDRLMDRDAILNNLQGCIPSAVQPVFTQYENAEALLQDYANGTRYDLIFLDVELQGTNGIEAGIQLRTMQPDLLLIFVSAYPSYAIPAYDCSPLYFLTKPIDPARFSQVFFKAFEKYKILHQHYVIKNKGQVNKLSIRDIYFVEMVRKHVLFHTATHTYETSTNTLAEVAKTLLPYGFYQVHQSILVNLDHIKSIAQYDILLENNLKIPVSVRKKSDVLKAFAEYIERTV